ncbi:MAG: SMP-30/gluconolactonase/LRE family protein [Phycisphaerales bacterium JB058]
MIAGVPSILVDRTFRLGENPLWDTQRGLLFWTDIDAGELWRYDPDTDKAECFYSGPKVGGFTLQQDGDLALFRVNDIALLDPENPGSVRTIAAFEDPDAERFNDVQALPDGSVYAGTIAARPGSGGLYHVAKDLAIRSLFKGTDVSNGMAVFDDGRSLLWTCSTSGRVVRFNRDTQTNELTDPYDLYKATPEEGTPDGLTRDIEGRIWSARWDGSWVIVHDADGNVSERLPVPTARVTSVCFGGPDLSTLYITTSEGPIYQARTKTFGLVEPRSGLGT